MNRQAVVGGLVAVGILLAIVVASSSMYTVNEREQVILTQFGEPKGPPVKTAGLKFKSPFIQKVNRIEKRILEWDGRANEMPT
ncbi:MAG: SPFH domain-containing protein, partial [Roseibacillus sp.]